jgi:hypothetical protein
MINNHVVISSQESLQPGYALTQYPVKLWVTSALAVRYTDRAYGSRLVQECEHFHFCCLGMPDRVNKVITCSSVPCMFRELKN